MKIGEGVIVGVLTAGVLGVGTWMATHAAPVFGKQVVEFFGGVTNEEFETLRTQVEAIPTSDPAVTAKTYETVAEMTVRRLEARGLVGIPGPQGEQGPPGPVGLSADNSSITQLQTQLAKIEKKLEDFIDKTSTANLSGLSEPISRPATAPVGTGKSYSNGIIDVTFDHCGHEGNAIHCKFFGVNLTDDTQQLCAGRDSVIVTPSGSQIKNLEEWTGERVDTNGVCSDLFPKTTQKFGISYYHYRDKLKIFDDIQYLKFDCGNRCEVEMYDVSVSASYRR